LSVLWFLINAVFVIQGTLVEGGCFFKTKFYFTSNAVVFIERTFCKKFYIVPSVVIIRGENRPRRTHRVSGGIAQLFLNPDTRRGMWSASRHGRPYPRESTHCTGGWVGPGAGLDRCGKSRPTGIRFPDLPARSESLYRLSYPGSSVVIITPFKSPATCLFL
jgi:hypothetical protein